jgi:hypothetical protein
MLMAQGKWRAGRHALDDKAGPPGSPRGAEPIGSRSESGKDNPPSLEKVASELSASKAPLAPALASATAVDGAEWNGPARGKFGSVENVEPETVEAKLDGLDWKIERIAGAVGAKIGSGVRKAATTGVGSDEHSVYRLLHSGREI